MRTLLLGSVAGLCLVSVSGVQAATLTYSTTMIPPDVFTPPDTSTNTNFPVVGTVENDHVSPFSDNTSPYVSVQSGGVARYNISGSALSFVYGSPDTYNVISFINSTGVFDTFSPTEATLSHLQNYFVTITPTAAFTAVEFSSSINALEFSNVSAVPLPASAPMFGAALLALVGFSYGRNRRAARKNQGVIAAA